MPEIDNKQVRSKRDQTLERLKSRYPDREFNDDEAVFGQIYDDYDDYDSRIKEYEDHEKTFSDMFASDPRSAHFLQSWRDGEHPMTALVRQFGKEGLEELVNNEERMDEFAKANEEYLERVAKEKELETSYQQNLQESLSYLEQFQGENGLSDEQVDQVMEFLVGIARDGIMGKFSPESIDMAMKAINHDVDVAEAGQDGEVRGKNAKIEERLRKRSKGDGTASLDGRNRGSGKAAPMPSLGALDNFDDGTKNIWERGGERRLSRT